MSARRSLFPLWFQNPDQAGLLLRVPQSHLEWASLPDSVFHALLLVESWFRSARDGRSFFLTPLDYVLGFGSWKNVPQ